jgi:hypothetical protein
MQEIAEQIYEEFLSALIVEMPCPISFETYLSWYKAEKKSQMELKRLKVIFKVLQEQWGLLMTI